MNKLLVTSLLTLALSIAFLGIKADNILGTAPRVFTTSQVGVTSSTISTINRVVKSSDYTATSTDVYIGITATSTITLPTAVGNAGKYFTIKDESGTAATTSLMRIIGTGAETIDGISSSTLLQNYASINVVSDGANWFIW